MDQPAASASAASAATVPAAAVAATVAASSSPADSSSVTPAVRTLDNACADQLDTNPPAAKKARTQKPAQAGGSKLFAASSSPSDAASASSASAPPPAPLFVCIIGGGLAGLSCALSLQAVGIRCRVFERDASISQRRQGFGLTLTNSPVGALAQLGVLQQCLAQDCASTCHYVFDQKGQILGYFGRSFLSEEMLQKQIKERQQQSAAEAKDATMTEEEAKDSSSSSAAGSSVLPAPVRATSVDPVSLLPLPSPSPAPAEASPSPPVSSSSASSIPASAVVAASSSSSAASSDSSSAPAASSSASPSPSAPARWWSSANLRIPRQDLRRMLFDRLDPALTSVTWGSRVRDYVESADGVTVTFTDGSTVSCDVLVGADGINSDVRKLQDDKAKERTGQLSYLGVAAIIGLSTASHPLLHQRGFYGQCTMPTFEHSQIGSAPLACPLTVSLAAYCLRCSFLFSFACVAMGSQHRLFTMPFRGARYGADGSLVEGPLTMWQLSYSEVDEGAARALGSTPASSLLQAALARTAGWMEPVAEMLAQTPLQDLWATALYDRTARRLRTKQQASRVTVVGDACHPMSMFKGQGANQALQDGPLLAKMLTLVDRNTPASALDEQGRPRLAAAALLNRLRRFEAQMVQRADIRVRASRAAAQALHSPEVSAPSDFFGIGGVPLSEEQLARVLHKCREKNIAAHLNERLDDAFGQLLDETVPPSERDYTRKTPKEDVE